MGYYLTNFEPEKDEKRYRTAILLSGWDLEIHKHPMPKQHEFWENDSYDPRNCQGYYSLYNPKGREDMSKFWQIYDQLRE